MVKLAVSTQHIELIPKAKELAQKLNLPLSDEDHNQADYVLLLTPEHLGLKKNLDKSLSMYVDFASNELNYRRKHLSLRKEALAKAMGLKHGTHPVIVDATAGLGRDSFIIAALGFHVILIERSVVNYALLADGIERGTKNPDIANIMQKMELVHADSIDFLTSLAKPDIIYIDPMFPIRKKTALSKKEMRIFHEVIGDDLDANALLNTALSCANDRVVVKRPRLAPLLADIKPSYTLPGSSSRFDVYLTREKP